MKLPHSRDREEDCAFEAIVACVCLVLFVVLLTAAAVTGDVR